MLCPKCQFENPDDAKFCIECANKMEFHCPNCGTITPATGKFCKDCGYDLKKSKEEPPPIKYSEPQSYTPKFLVDKILTSKSSMEGERKLVTVLFADVANYTAISEKLDPEEVHHIMDGCFKILMDEIHKFEGTINQFTGDGVMALFGAPISHEDHAQRACRAALAIQKTMDEYGEKISGDCGVEFKLRIGLNSGPVIVGAIGDDLRMDYTAVGDTTNLAMRMESTASPGTIQISENSYQLVKAYFEIEDLGPITVKGKEAPQNIFRLAKSSDVQTRFEASVSKGLVKFVGRSNSMAVIKDAWDKARSGSGQVLGVVGEAGVGKSRLLLEFRHSIANENFNYFEGQCLHYGVSMAYLPFLDILRSYFDITEGQREYIIKKNIKEKLKEVDEESLSGSIPAFQDLLSLKIEDEGWHKLEPQQRRERTFESARNLFMHLSKERPLILAVEDLHWMDKTSEEFLSYFIDSMAQSPILLILLYRPEYTHQWGSKTYYSKIGLDQLTLKSSAELVSAILEGGNVAPELKDLILNRSAGNPLFMEEFTHTLLENGSIEQKNNQFVLNRKIDDIQVPDTIQGIIAARMDRLEENLKRTMQVASVVGRDFAFRILHTITGMREELKSYLLNLQGLEFIYEKSLFPELEYIFKHALTKEVAYNSLLQKRRKEIHEKIGRAIEELYPERQEEFYEMLAYHYSKSDSLIKACRYSRLSGQKAEGKYSHQESYSFYSQTFDLLKKLPENEDNKKEKLEVLFLMKTPMQFLGFPDGSIEMLQEGERLSKEVGDNRYLAIFYSVLSTYYTHRGNSQLGMKYSEEAFEQARKNQDIEMLAPLSFSLLVSYRMAGELYKIAEMAPSVIDLLEKTERESDFFSMGANPYTMLCAFYGLSMGYLGNFNEGKDIIQRGLSNARHINDPFAVSMSEMAYGQLFMIRGDWERAIELFKNAIQHSEEAKYVLGAAMGWSLLGYATSHLGDPQAGLRYAEKGLKMHLESGVELWMARAHLFLGTINFELGDFKNAKECAKEALRLARKNNEKDAEGISWVFLGRTLGKTGESDVDKAEEYLWKGMEILQELKIRPYYSLGHLFLGELFMSTDEQEKAIVNLKKAKTMFKEMGMDYWLNLTQEFLKGF